MAPKTKYTKEDIINAAFDIARKRGFNGITIRNVAKKLGSSIAPIYVNFSDVEELKLAVVEKAQETAKQIYLEQNSGLPFRDIGIASIKFASEYSVLYRDLVMKYNPYMKHNEENMLFIIGEMKKDPHLKGYSEEDLKQGLIKLEIFQTGLSVMVANDLLPGEFNEEKMIAMLDDIAEDIFIAAKVRKGEM